MVFFKKEKNELDSDCSIHGYVALIVIHNKLNFLKTKL